MLCVFCNGDFTPRYPIWVLILGHGYKFVNMNRPTHCSFHWENGLVINNFHTITPNSLKPSQCTLTYQKLSSPKTTKSIERNVMVWEIATW
jgi:hypothetical protein